MTHKHSCSCPDCRRVWGDPRERLRRFLRRLDAGEYNRGHREQRIIESEGKSIVICDSGQDAYPLFLEGLPDEAA
jgi:hypothetical protein